MSPPTEPKNAFEHDLRCSNACTKAGLTALLFSALAISLLQPIEKKEYVNALENYISLRSLLNIEIRNLYEDPCWKSLSVEEKLGFGPEQWSLYKLLEYQCGNDIPRKKIKKHPHPDSAPKQTNKKKESNQKRSDIVALTPPSNVTWVRELDGLKNIIGALAGLSSKHLLNKARKATIRYDHYIYAWGSLLVQMTRQNREKGIPTPETKQEPKIDLKINGEEIKVENSFVQHLTLLDAKKLSSYDPPSPDYS